MHARVMKALFSPWGMLTQVRVRKQAIPPVDDTLNRFIIRHVFAAFRSESLKRTVRDYSVFHLLLAEQSHFTPRTSANVVLTPALDLLVPGWSSFAPCSQPY